MRKSILGMILAGGEGSRLSPLTTKRAKPAVPFGGKYRIIDFVLSNFVNSGIHSLFVLTQFRSQSMSEHIINGWNMSSLMKGQFVVPVPAQMQGGDKRWYEGTADAIWQNIHLLQDFTPDLVAVFGGDHIYKMDISQMAKFHAKREALATIAALPIPLEEGSRFGIIQIDEDWRITGFQEKPEHPSEIPGMPGYCLASMGNYVFDSKWLYKTLKADSQNPDSHHDFGHDILPPAVDSGRLYAYNFFENKIPGSDVSKDNYWRDVGTLKSYYDSNMDLKEADPQLDLYGAGWPIHTYNSPLPPAKFVHDEHHPDGRTRVGHATNSIVCDGCIVSGSSVKESILSSEVHVHSFSSVESSIILNSVEIFENCKIKNAIIDKHVILPPGTVIGYDRQADESRFHVVDLCEEEGTWLTVIEKNHSRVSKDTKTTVLTI
ncbi:glucose-1-phosphate adenylyltransferase [Lentisphaera marina]|nr:glucose-1-phosphate adenylyltransferase [Lentisphaera marina]MDD7984465.1 glucose-1-phosphate adenylyltransferase [Lentisphaera marina]